MSNLQYSKNNKGFTLVETLVAIAVLLLAVAAPLSLATRSLNSSVLSKQQIIASFLAQEAMEYIRNVRDENVAKHNDWLHADSGIQNCFNGKCTVDPTAISGVDKIKKCQNDICPPLRYRSSLAIYSYDEREGAFDSIFTREVVMADVINNIEVAVSATVFWLGPNGVTYKVFARENLTNWQY